MRTISAQSITDTVARLCIEANTRLPQDVEAALARAREEEPWPLAKTTLDLLWSNLGAAQEKALPICQDTGMACVFVELGTDVHIDGSFEAAIHEGVRRGYTDGYPRKSIVAARQIKAGEVFTEENLTTKRPGDGISPMRWHEILGQTAKRDFAEDEKIEV